jgi:hypothetical protein
VEAGGQGAWEHGSMGHGARDWRQEAGDQY